MAASWYAIRTKPGYQRVAAEREGSRKGETLIERNLRNGSIDVFMPSHWFETRHHRTNKIIERRLPLLVGYTFVYITDSLFEDVRKIDGVMSFLKFGNDYTPIRFPEKDIERLIFDDFERHQAFLFEQMQRKELARTQKVLQLRTSLRKMLPKGRGVRINMRAQAEKAIQSMNGPAKDRIMSILTELDRLESDDQELGKVA